MEKKKPVITGDLGAIMDSDGKLNESILNFDKEIDQQEKVEQEANLEVIKSRQDKAKLLIKKFSKPIIATLEDIEFVLKPITVALWDEIDGDKESVKAQTIVVRESLISPKLDEHEFNGLPGGLKLKLFLILIQDFFLTAGKVKRKSIS